MGRGKREGEEEGEMKQHRGGEIRIRGGPSCYPTPERNENGN